MDLPSNDSALPDTEASARTEVVSARVWRSTRELLEARARAEGLTVSDMARTLLERALDDDAPTASDRILQQLQSLTSSSLETARAAEVGLLKQDILEIRHLLVSVLERASTASIVSQRVLGTVLPGDANRPVLRAELDAQLDEELDACQVAARHYAGKQQPAANTNQKAAGQ